MDIRTEVIYGLELENQHGENTTFVKTTESDEVLGHDLQVVQALAPMIRNG